MVDSLSPTELRNVFGDVTFRRGQAYQLEGRVTSLNVGTDGGVLATVQGTGEHAYIVRIRSLELAKVKRVGVCTCPVSSGCKHIVATLLQLLKDDRAEAEAPKDPTPGLPPEFREWLSELDDVDETGDSYPEDQKNRLVYVVSPASRGPHVLRIYTARLLKSGGYSDKPTSFDPALIYRGSTAAHVQQSDRAILADVNRLPSRSYGGAPLTGPLGRQVLIAMIATNRCRLGDVNGLPIVLGPQREAQGRWTVDDRGVQKFRFAQDDHELSLSFDVPWYLDIKTGEAGPIDTGFDHHLGFRLLEMPSLQPENSATVRAELERRFPEREDVWPRIFKTPLNREETPTPILTLAVVPLNRQSYYSRVRLTEGDQALVAKVAFQYGPRRLPFPDNGNQIAFLEGDQPVRLVRGWSAETERLQVLVAHGWTRFEEHPLRLSYELPKGYADAMVLTESSRKHAGPGRIQEFLHRIVPQLEADGWIVEMAGDLRIATLKEDAAWHIETTESANTDWFGLNLGVEFEDRRINLMPILVGLLKDLPPGTFLTDKPPAPEEQVVATLEDGRKIALPAARVFPLLRALYELYDGAADGAITGLHRAKAPQLGELDGLSWLSWHGNPRIRKLARELHGFEGIKAVEPPVGLLAELRTYQREGLNWLQFLREYGFGGVLADDMGLGKTVQAIAHVLTEKAAGRLDKPCLVVAPTSLMANWRLEIERFAPNLTVLTLHGSDRHDRFAEIDSHDVVLTTYPLLGRDAPFLLHHEYAIAILDEAQNIKNPKSIMAHKAFELKARHRICLTGTPLENHLGELWSIFRFLMPGFLGTDAQFRKTFQLPIEREPGGDRQRALAKRIAPFMIRRTKSQVASELPPKTEILEAIELEGGQRDLYESVRLAMHDRVRNAIRTQGVSRSHIVILDALLKLRQVCCDPHLVKLEDARKVNRSAKLERLMEMVPEMLAEGRRILIFSQFTSMLAIIEAELKKREIDYALLTGETTDRPKQIDKFQKGGAPIFLISLKAGGTGLNLTAADTVIHYDPWWNPAAEAQASDRAHRIGQSKNVFVYRLIALGTVEEKIAELQERKKQLAAGIFSEDAAAPMELTATDLDDLFAAPG